MIFHNGSNDDYDFIVKKPAEEFEGQLFSSSRKTSYKNW